MKKYLAKCKNRIDYNKCTKKESPPKSIEMFSKENSLNVEILLINYLKKTEIDFP
jgi:hypothetical protein